VLHETPPGERGIALGDCVDDRLMGVIGLRVDRRAVSNRSPSEMSMYAK
jgi:hypothetical protein